MTTQVVMDRGSLIRLEGLIKGAHLNGCTGTILAYENNKEKNENSKEKSESSSSSSGGRYQVQLDQDGKVVLVKKENVVPISFVESMTRQGFHILECTPSFLDTSSDNTNVILGGGRHIPAEHIDFLPRRAELPSRKFTFYNDMAKKCFFQMHEGDFVAAWKFILDDEKGKSMEFRFGLKKDEKNLRGPFLLLVQLHFTPARGAFISSSHSARLFAALADDNKAAVTDEFLESLGSGDNEQIQLQSGASPFVVEFAKGFSIDALDHLRFRVLHHVLRQHGASLPYDRLDGLFSLMFSYFMSNSNEDSNRNVKKKKLLEYLDLQVVRADIEASVQGITYITRLSNVAVALGAVEEHELAGRVYVRTAERYRDFSSLNTPWQCYWNGGIAFRRAEMFEPSEQCYIKALQGKYEHDGNRLLMHDPEFRNLMKNMLTMYSYFTAEGDWSTGGGSTSTIAGNLLQSNYRLVWILDTLLCVSGFQTDDDGSIVDMSDGRDLKPQYRTTSAARTVLQDAIQISTTSVDAFCSMILDCMAEDRQSQYLLNTVKIGNFRRSARDDALDGIQEYCRGYKAELQMQCFRPGCKKAEISGMTAADSEGRGGKLMQCPCRTVMYCGKECQTAHWKEHKKLCPLRQATAKKKMMSRGKDQSE